MDYSLFLKLKDRLCKLINPDENSLGFYYLGVTIQPPLFKDEIRMT